MYFVECRQYLIEHLKAAGMRGRIYTKDKDVRQSSESHKGAVISETETFEFSGQKVIYRDQAGDKRKRTKVMDRETNFVVMIGGAVPEQCEEVFERFISGLDQGIEIDGNYIPLEVVSADWYDDEDEVLRAKFAVLVKVKFSGGVFRDGAKFLKVNDVVSAAEMEK